MVDGGPGGRVLPRFLGGPEIVGGPGWSLGCNGCICPGFGTKFSS
jgi:hypothetical protein